MTKKTPESRRKLLKSIAAGSGAIVAGKSLPESWSKPVVDAVMLPAHAETTDDSGSSGGGATTTTTTTANPCCLVHSGYCGVIEAEDYTIINIEVSAEGSVEVGIIIGKDGPRYEGAGSIPCTGGEFTIQVAYVPKPSSDSIAFAPPENLTVTGKVVCNQDTISGTISDSSRSINYSAGPCSN